MRRRMPIMNGDVATAALRARGLTMPIVGITGDAHKDDLALFAARGADEVPVSMCWRSSALRGRDACACATLCMHAHASVVHVCLSSVYILQVITKPVSRAAVNALLDKYLGHLSSSSIARSTKVNDGADVHVVWHRSRARAIARAIASWHRPSCLASARRA
jgi:CheY-like chemotaxis protein